MKKLGASQIFVASFLLLILVGTLLLSLPIATVEGSRAPALTALFTATTAVCVTGLVVVDTGTFWSPFGQVVIMGLIQLGGLGLMTFTTIFAVLLGKKIGLQERLNLQQSLNQLKTQGVVRLITFIVTITLIIEGAGAIILALRWSALLGWKQAWYYGIFHAVSAFNNAGIDLFGRITGKFSSLISFQTDPIVTIVIAGLIILGGLGFTVIYELVQKKSLARLTLHSKIVLWVTGILIVGGTLGVYLLEYSNPKTMGGLSQGGRLLTAFFQAVTPRTAGFNTVDLPSLTMPTKLLIILLMFIGASPGSTGGGVKTTTITGVLVSMKSAILGREDVEIFQRRIPQYIVGKMLAVMGGAVIWVFLATLALTITERADFLTILFEVVSAFGTVGLSLGLTTELSVIGKLVIILTMIMGRVGPLTLAIAITERSHRTHNLRYPEEKIIVG